MKKILIGVLCLSMLLVLATKEETIGSAMEKNAELIQPWKVADPFYHIVEMNQQNMELELARAEREKEAEIERVRLELKAKEKAAAKAKEEAEEVKRKAEESKKSVKAENFDKNQSNTKKFKVSFYTALPGENGGHGLMANGESVVTARNVVASNYYPLGTKIYLEGWGTMTVSDRGGSHFDSSDRLDILVTRKSGESDSQYKARAMQLGRQTISGYIIK